MNTQKVLIVSDTDNHPYWSAMTHEIEEKIGPVHIIKDKDIFRRKIDHLYEVIVVDVSDIEDLHRLISEIHQEQPKSRILILFSSPTWKAAREVIRLGAADVIRKSADLDEVFKAVRPLEFS